MSVRRLLTLAVALVAHVEARTIPEPPSATEPAAVPASSVGKRKGFPVVAASLGSVGLVVGAVPAARRAVFGLVKRALGDDLELPKRQPPEDAIRSERQPAPQAQAPSTAAPAADADADAADAGQKFSLTPEKLAAISELNPRLEEIGPMLASVPIFTAAVGNGTSPLTVPTEDGRKLAYFFTEQADAEAFLNAVKANTGMKLEANVIGVSLADIIRAYSSDDAKDAKESFVIVPTMAEVAAARQIMKQAGKEADLATLGPGSGLVPIFWSEALAVQSAGGQQRKVLFFRLGDLQAMWQSLAEARKEQGELDEMPQGPTVQVSDLQTMSQLLVAANKTDDVMFLPSSNAIKHAKGQVGRAGSTGGEARGAAAPQTGGDAAAEEEVDETLGVEGEEEEAFV